MTEPVATAPPWPPGQLRAPRGPDMGRVVPGAPYPPDDDEPDDDDV